MAEIVSHAGCKGVSFMLLLKCLKIGEEGLSGALRVCLNYTANVLVVIFLVFSCVSLSAVLQLYF